MVTATVAAMVTTQLQSGNVSRSGGHFTLKGKIYSIQYFQVPVYKKVCNKEPVEVLLQCCFLSSVAHCVSLFQSCKKVPREVPVAREVCNKEPVQVTNSFLCFNNIDQKPFQSCSQVPKEVPVSKEVCNKKPVQVTNQPVS